jgi:hypothetical protein
VPGGARDGGGSVAAGVDWGRGGGRVGREGGGG